MSKYLEELKRQQKRVGWIISGIDFDNLTEWEQNFFESIERQSLNGKLLSDRQMEIAERIYKEKGT